MAVPAAQTDEYRAAREAVAWADSSAREQLRVTGPERTSFMQGMVTNDVEGLAAGQSCYAAVLTPKGAMVGDLRVLKRDDDLVLDTNPGQAATVKAFLETYLISEDAEIVLAPELAVVSLLGPGAAALAGSLPGKLATLADPLGVDVLVPREKLGEVKAALAAVPQVSEPTLEVLRVEAGVPRFGVDMTTTTIPLEANLNRAIHLQKGCYIGQEVIARATYRGQMNKKLMGLLLGEADVAAGVELRKGDRKAGWLTTVVRSEKKGQVVALGYVHRDFAEPGTELALVSGGNAVVATLPF